MNRRSFLTRSGLGVLATAGTCLAFQGDNNKGDNQNWGNRVKEIPDGSASKGMITARCDEAIKKGLAYLNSRRDRDGSYGTGPYKGNVAIAALAGMAFMCGGNQPNRGLYGKAVLDTIRYILGKENAERKRGYEGFLHNPRIGQHGPMYGHGFATLFLAEVSGMVHEPKLRDELRMKLHLAVGLILRAQRISQDGAWRYNPDSRDADLSVTICQIMALRSAKNAGIDVPKSAVDRCTDYVKACQDRREGWFRYTKQGGGGGGQQAFARTAAGVCALNAAGIYLEQSDEVRLGLDFLKNNKPGPGLGRAADMHYFYGHYYAVQAMWTAGGNYWNDWFPMIRDELLNRQNADGSWQDAICNHYGTAMACIILQVPNNYLPILQK
jgi:hypothetical protein